MTHTSGPMLVAVADEPAAINECAVLQPTDRHFDMVELRLDRFPGQRVGACADACRTLETTGVRVIASIRRSRHGGRYEGTTNECVSRYCDALEIVSWADVQYEEADDAELVARISDKVEYVPNGQIVVSYCDYERTPPLEWLLHQVEWSRSLADLKLLNGRPTKRAKDAIVTMATTVSSESDVETLRNVGLTAPGRTCVVGMHASEQSQVELAAVSVLAYGYWSNPIDEVQASVNQLHEGLLVVSEAYRRRHQR